MASFTPNLNLEKPTQNDFYDVDIFNANADKIDGFIGGYVSESGEFTPQLWATPKSGGSDINFDLSESDGYYRREGNLVHFYIYITVNLRVTPIITDAQLYITEIPFSPLKIEVFERTDTTDVNSSTSTFSDSAKYWVLTGDRFIARPNRTIYLSGSGGFNTGDLQDGASMVLSGVYRIAEGGE